MRRTHFPRSPAAWTMPYAWVVRLWGLPSILARPRRGSCTKRRARSPRKLSPKVWQWCSGRIHAVPVSVRKGRPQSMWSPTRRRSPPSSERILLKPAHNSGSNAPPPFIDDLFDVSDRSVMPMVVQKKHLIEPHTGDDKGARARQAFRGAGFEGTGLDDALEEQLDGFAPIGIEVTFPRVRIRRQLLGGEQPAAVLRIGGHEVGPAKRRVAQQQFGNGELIGHQGLLQHRTFPHRVGTPTGKEGHGGRKDQALQDQAIPLDPAPVATLGPRRLHVHVAQTGGNPLLCPVAGMPERALGL